MVTVGDHVVDRITMRHRENKVRRCVHGMRSTVIRQPPLSRLWKKDISRARVCGRLPRGPVWCEPLAAGWEGLKDTSHLRREREVGIGQCAQD